MVRQEERRRSPRWDCALACLCEGDDFASYGMIVNLSCGGAGISGTEKLPRKNGTLRLTILRLAEEMELPSRVVWVHLQTPGRGKPNFGVEFTASLKETRRKLEAFFPNRMKQ